MRWRWPTARMSSAPARRRTTRRGARTQPQWRASSAAAMAAPSARRQRHPRGRSHTRPRARLSRAPSQELQARTQARTAKAERITTLPWHMWSTSVPWRRRSRRSARKCAYHTSPAVCDRVLRGRSPQTCPLASHPRRARLSTEAKAKVGTIAKRGHGSVHPHLRQHLIDFPWKQCNPYLSGYALEEALHPCVGGSDAWAQVDPDVRKAYIA